MLLRAAVIPRSMSTAMIPIPMALIALTLILGRQTLFQSTCILYTWVLKSTLTCRLSWLWNAHKKYTPDLVNAVYEFQGGAFDGWYVSYQCSYSRES